MHAAQCLLAARAGRRGSQGTGALPLPTPCPQVSHAHQKGSGVCGDSTGNRSQRAAEPFSCLRKGRVRSGFPRTKGLGQIKATERPPSGEHRQSSISRGGFHSSEGCTLLPCGGRYAAASSPVSLSPAAPLTPRQSPPHPTPDPASAGTENGWPGGQRPRSTDTTATGGGL